MDARHDGRALVSCAFSRTLLALHVEGDLSRNEAMRTAMHLATCAECRQFVDELQASQTLLRSLRRETVERDACAGMRQGVMRIIEGGQVRTGWWLRFERAFFGVRTWHAVAAALLVSIVSASVLAQMRQPAPDSSGDSRMAAAVFEGRDVLLRPEGYADWFVVGAAEGGHHPGGNVFMNPSSYREYAKTGRFPEGTMMVWASEENGIVRDSTAAGASSSLRRAPDPACQRPARFRTRAAAAPVIVATRPPTTSSRSSTRRCGRRRTPEECDHESSHLVIWSSRH
jgi:hypothetical protein